MTGQATPWAAELALAAAATRAAAAAITAHYAARDARVYRKPDGSPVTDADLAADRILRAHVGLAFPDDPILTEEGEDPPARLLARRCWLADPLDGTQQFINRTDEFDVLLALVVDGRPVTAAACHPVSGAVLTAAAGQGAWIEDGRGRRRLEVPPVGTGVRLGTNRSHTRVEDWPLLLRVADRAGVARPERRDVFHARGFFDLGAGARYEAYLGLGPPPGGAVGGEWDFAAPDLILREAGGLLTDEQGATLRYNRPDPLARHGVIVAADPAVHARLVAALAREDPPAR